MGREIRRVPPTWEHPRQRRGEGFQPLYDEDFETAMQKWLDELDRWRREEFARVRSEYPDKYNADTPLTAFVDWHGEAPDPKYRRPRWTTEEATHYQLYETVSEGTPLSPVFATTAELVDYLVEHGDGWDRPVSREAAEAFVRMGSVPSMVIVSGRMITGVAIADDDALRPPK